MTNWDFASSDPVDISVDNWTAGSIVVSGEPTDSITVQVVPSRRSAGADLDQVEVAFEDGQLYINGPRVGTFRRKQGLDLTIKAPAGSSCAAKTVSADLSCVGEVSGVSMQTASGDLTAACVVDVAVRSASGDVLLNRATGTISVHTASGDVQAAQVDGDVRVNTASGDVNIGFCRRRGQHGAYRERGRAADRCRGHPGRAGQYVRRSSGRRPAPGPGRLPGPSEQLGRDPQ